MAGSDSQPNLSPDGKQVLFVRRVDRDVQEIWLASVDLATPTHPLSSNRYSSGDGRTRAFSFRTGHAGLLQAVRSDGSSLAAWEGRMIETEGIMTAREELHRLIDRIPESDVATTQKLLRALVDPVELAILSAEEDEEPEGEDERAAVDAAMDDPSADIPFDQLRRVRM